MIVTKLVTNDKDVFEFEQTEGRIQMTTNPEYATAGDSHIFMLTATDLDELIGILDTQRQKLLPRKGGES